MSEYQSPTLKIKQFARGGGMYKGYEPNALVQRPTLKRPCSGQRLLAPMAQRPEDESEVSRKPFLVGGEATLR